MLQLQLLQVPFWRNRLMAAPNALQTLRFDITSELAVAALRSHCRSLEHLDVRDVEESSLFQVRLRAKPQSIAARVRTGGQRLSQDPARNAFGFKRLKIHALLWLCLSFSSQIHWVQQSWLHMAPS